MQQRRQLKPRLAETPPVAVVVTAGYWSGCGSWWRPRFTPTHTSWLNQAKLLAGAFDVRYLKRGSWASREELIEQVLKNSPQPGK